MKTVQRYFRPTEANEKRLATAQELGMNVNDIVNEALEKCGKVIIEAKMKKLREALAVDIP